MGGEEKGEKGRRLKSALTFSDGTAIFTWGRQDIQAGHWVKVCRCVWTFQARSFLLHPLGNRENICCGFEQDTNQSPVSDVPCASGPSAECSACCSTCWTWWFVLQNSLQSLLLLSPKQMCQTACLLCPRPPHQRGAPILCSIQAS